MTKTSKKAFSLIELMTVIAIIGILSAVIVVNLNSAKISSRNKAVFTQIMSTQPMAYKCLKSGIAAVTLGAPTAGSQICSTSGYSTWPTLDSNSGWIYSTTRSVWCNFAASPSVCSPYSNGTCGGNNANGAFCYRFINNTDNSKTITCTQYGCVKAGF